MTPRTTFAAVTSLFMVFPLAALADSIDGTWCSPDGSRTMQIHGQDFTTPGGAKVTGIYQRHDGAYTAPEGEPGAGGTVIVQLLNEEEMRVAEPDATPLVWLRCQLNA